MDHDLMSAEARIERERAFHDERFADDSGRAATGKFYRAVPGAKADYRASVHRLATGRVLEYGCGVGSLAFELAGKSEVVGIDISPVAIAEARSEAAERGVEVEFLEMNAEALELPDGSFDLVCGSGILHHLDVDRAIGEVTRVLAPGGRAVFLEPMGYNPLINWYRDRTPGMRTDDEHPLLRCDFDTIGRSVRRLDLRFHGLAALAAAPFVDRPGGARLRRGLAGVDAALTRAPGLRLLSWIVVLEIAV